MREFNGADFLIYVQGLSNDGNPFDCPRLRILPEDVLNFDENCRYRKGMLVCTSLSSRGEGYWHSRCRVLRTYSLYPNERGEIEVLCNMDKGKFTLKIQDFESGP